MLASRASYVYRRATDANRFRSKIHLLPGFTSTIVKSRSEVYRNKFHFNDPQGENYKLRELSGLNGGIPNRVEEAIRDSCELSSDVYFKYEWQINF